MLTVLAKAGNSSVVGQFALGLAITAPVFMFTNLQLRGMQVTDARREYCFADYFTLRIVTTAFGLFSVVALLFVLHYDYVTRVVILFIAIAKSIECVSDVIGGLLQFHERLDQAAISLMTRGALSILLFGVTFLWSHSLIACTGAMCLAWLTVLIGYDLRRANETVAFGEQYFRFNWRTGWKLLLLGLPLGIVMMLLSLNANIPRYVLEHYKGPAELGVYASLAYLLVAMSTVVNALGQSVMVRLSSMFAACNFDGFKRLLFKLVAIGVAMTVVGLPLAAIFGRSVLTLLYRPAYGEQMGAFLIMVAATGVSAIGAFLGCGVTAARCFRAQVPLVAACTLAAGVTTALMVPHYGLAGAASGLLASSIVLVVGCALVLQMAIARARKDQTVENECS
jgi:O-antigen/teichoic acid export membrane protein